MPTDKSRSVTILSLASLPLSHVDPAGVGLLPAGQDQRRSAVQVVERLIMARLCHRQFDSVHVVNAAMARLLTRLNDNSLQNLPGGRASTFARLMRRPCYR